MTDFDIDSFLDSNFKKFSKKKEKKVEQSQTNNLSNNIIQKGGKIMKEKIFDIILSRTLFGCKFWIVWDVCFFIIDVLCLAIGGGFVFGFFAILMLIMLFWNAMELKEFKKKK